jgi:hypothetical protein
MAEDVKYCKNCGKPIPRIVIDRLGRRTTHTSDFCKNRKKCLNEYVTKILHPNYDKEYYQRNKDKFKGYRKKYEAKKSINISVPVGSK